MWWSGAAPTTPSLTVAPIAATVASTPFVVAGNFYNDALNMIDYSFDGATWIAASSPIISSNSYTFQVPGLAAGAYVLHVRDHVNTSVAAISNSFAVESPNITFSTTPNSGSVGIPIVVAGTVIPGNSAVQVGISSSASSAPTGFVSATVALGNWSASVIPESTGTVYLWAEQSNNTGISAVSAAVLVSGGALTVSAPTSAIVGSAFAVTGTVTPANSSVTVQISAQNATAPASAGTAATVTGGNFSATLTPATEGTFYVWAQDQADNLSAVSGAVTVAVQSSINYTINQPGTTSYAHGSGTIAINGSINPAQNIATQAALSISNTNPPTAGWQPASIIDNNALWALYLTTPAVPGSYYVWVEETSGIGAAVSTFTLTIT